MTETRQASCVLCRTEQAYGEITMGYIRLLKSSNVALQAEANYYRGKLYPDSQGRLGPEGQK